MIIESNPLPFDTVTYHAPYAQRASRTEIVKWLDEYEGTGRVWPGGYGLYFENSEDAMMFTLRWG